MNRTSREEIIAVVGSIVFILFVGSCIGWVARAVSTRDKYLIATAERFFAERDYYAGEYQKIMNENRKGEVKHGK
jgi:hypothetical protein